MSKILFASDIHGRKSRAARLAEIVKAENPDRVYLLGDYLYNGPRNGVPEDYDPMAVIASLSEFKDRILGVRGNCDAAIDLELLPFPIEDFRTVKENGRTLILSHGDRLDEIENLERGDFVVFGHYHIPMIKEEKGVLMLNPGSISFPKKGHPASYLLFEDDTIELRDILTNETIRKVRLNG